MLEATEQRPVNNEHVNSWISKLSPVTLAGISKLYANFYQRCKQETTRSTVKCFIVYYYFPLSGKNNYVVEEFSVERQRAIISWDHYLTNQGEPGCGDSLPIPASNTLRPIPRLETVKSQIQTEGEN